MTQTAGQLEELLKRATIPPLPKVAHTLISLFNDPDATVQEIGGVLRLDPALSLRLLKVANSPLFGQRSHVSSVERAMVVLGLNYVKTISLAMQLTAPLRSFRSSALEMEDFWRDALLRACVARQCAQHTRAIDHDIAFLTGLVLDFGVPIMAERLGASYAEALARYRHFPLDLHAWECRSLPFTHADVAAELLKSWNMPEELYDPIAHHHDFPTDDACDNIAGRMVAYFAGMLPLSVNETPNEPAKYKAGYERVTEFFKLGPDSISKILLSSKAEFETLSALFDDLLPDDCEIERALASACKSFTTVDGRVFELVFT